MRAEVTATAPPRHWPRRRHASPKYQFLRRGPERDNAEAAPAVRQRAGHCPRSAPCGAAPATPRHPLRHATPPACVTRHAGPDDGLLLPLRRPVPLALWRRCPLERSRSHTRALPRPHSRRAQGIGSVQVPRYRTVGGGGGGVQTKVGMAKFGAEKIWRPFLNASGEFWHHLRGMRHNKNPEAKSRGTIWRWVTHHGPLQGPERLPGISTLQLSRPGTTPLRPEGGASIGQVWTRHLAPTAPAVTAFIAHSVRPSVRLAVRLSSRLDVLFPSSLDGARDKACRFWALAPGQFGFVGVLSPGHGGRGGGGALASGFKPRQRPRMVAASS